VADESPPYWRLISVLFSSFPLTPGLAMRLYRSAFELYRSDGGVLEIGVEDDDVVSGEVQNLKQVASLGAITGPAFEARLDTARGEGVVRFLITHQGIEMMASRQAHQAN
jgi:hypothetical protein